MPECDNLLDDLITDLQRYIELSFQENDLSLKEWIEQTIKKIDSHCWEKHKCNNTDCPAYKSDCGRCWLITGTMCGGRKNSKFATKYESCIECDVYKDIVGNDKVFSLRELTLILIHSLRLKQSELKEALSEIKTLSGLIPICASCKKIRDDKGYWKQIEEYISYHSEAEFSHSICPDCTKRLYPKLTVV
ncbi:MAG: hypothetical protein OEM02_14270 [Desulfobulbaceae bacterium]|nr:hypothetical protein [Desulfobulbaceae bacterium]